MMSDEDYDVVTDVLKKHLNVLLEMINSSAEQNGFSGMDQIRLDQINQLDQAIRIWNERDAAEVEYNNAKAVLEEKGGGKIEVCPGVTLDQFKVALLTDDKSEEFENWCKESDD